MGYGGFRVAVWSWRFVWRSKSNGELPQVIETPAEKKGALAIGATALGTTVLGSLAVGAIAIGAIAIGALAIGRLGIKQARIERLQIGRLDIEEIRRLPKPEKTTPKRKKKK
jgi:hypothetical protein